MESTIKEVIQIIDSYLIETGKADITLSDANILLKEQQDDEIKYVNLEALLENNKIPNAYLTQPNSKHWLIPYSDIANFNKKRQEYLSNNVISTDEINESEEADKLEEVKTNNWIYVLFIIAVILVYYLMVVRNNSSTQKEETSSPDLMEDAVKSFDNDMKIHNYDNKGNEEFNFKSNQTFQDYNGKTIHSTSKTTYHNIDFENKTITSKLPFNGNWETIKYPMKKVTRENTSSGLQITISVKTKGMNQIFLYPNLSTLVYDYDDGTTVVIKNLTPNP